jgi:hypothetical protein
MEIHTPSVEGFELAGPITYPIDLCAMENTSFKAGERITLKLYYKFSFVWVAAGEAVFGVEEENDQYKLFVEGKSYSFFDKFFKVRDYYTCWVDKQSLLPIQSIRDVHEGEYTLYDHMTFDHDDNTIESNRSRRKKPFKRNTFPVENCMHDILSIIYYIRNLEFDDIPDSSLIPIHLFMDEETYDLKVQYFGKERKRIKGWGNQQTLHLSPEVIEGYVFTEKDRVKLWVTDDENRLPLLIETPLSVGSVRVVLKNYSGIRNPKDIKK